MSVPGAPFWDGASRGPERESRAEIWATRSGMCPGLKEDRCTQDSLVFGFVPTLPFSVGLISFHMNSGRGLQSTCSPQCTGLEHGRPLCWATCLRTRPGGNASVEDRMASRCCRCLRWGLAPGGSGTQQDSSRSQFSLENCQDPMTRKKRRNDLKPTTVTQLLPASYVSPRGGGSRGNRYNVRTLLPGWVSSIQ